MHLDITAPSQAASPRREEWTLAAEPASVSAARRHTRRFLDGQAITDDATVVVSELVTNAIQHGSGPVTLVLMFDGGVLHGAVTDHGHGLPVLTRIPEEEPDAPGDENGRGLPIVDALVDRWGMSFTPDRRGKTVWFRMESPPEVGPAA